MQYIVHSLIATFSSFENFKNLHAMDILYINILHCFLLDRQYTNNVVHFMKHAYIDPVLIQCFIDDVLILGWCTTPSNYCGG